VEQKKTRKKKGRIKADEKCKCFLDRFVDIAGTGEPTEESAASNIQAVNSSNYVCLVHNRCAIHKSSSSVKMKLMNTCFRTFIFLSKDKDFFFISLS